MCRLLYTTINRLLRVCFYFVIVGQIGSPGPLRVSAAVTDRGEPNSLASKGNSSWHRRFRYGVQSENDWINTFRICGGTRQSPINIDTTECLPVHHPQLFWWNYNLKPTSMSLVNNGHTLQLTSSWSSPELVPYFWQSPGDENFILDHLHFHWGLNSEDGTEHSINHQRFALELHAVHYNRLVGNLAQAMAIQDGVRVVSILFMISDFRNPALDPIVDNLAQVRSPSSVSIEPFLVGHLVSKFAKAFALYNGSLTTPPCLEVVTWVVKLTPSTISLDQINEFRQLRNYAGDFISGNVRQLQKINDRSIFHVVA